MEAVTSAVNILHRVVRIRHFPVIAALRAGSQSVSQAKSRILSRAFHRSQKTPTESSNEPVIEVSSDQELKPEGFKTQLDSEIKQFMITLKPVEFSWDERDEKSFSLKRKPGPKSLSSRQILRRSERTRVGKSPEILSALARSTSAVRTSEKPKYRSNPTAVDNTVLAAKQSQAEALKNSMIRELKVHSDLCPETIEESRRFIESVSGYTDCTLLHSISVIKELQSANHERPKGAVDRLCPTSRPTPESPEHKLNELLKNLTVRRLQELRSSPQLSAETVEIVLGLIILFSSIDKEMELNPGRQVMRSRASKLVQSYLTIPGNVLRVCRSYVARVKKGDITMNIVRQCHEHVKKIKPPKSPSSTLGIIYAFLRCAVDFYLEWAGHPGQAKKSARSSDDVGFSTQSDTVSELSAINDGTSGYKTPDSNFDPITFRNSVSSEMSQGRSTLKTAEIEQRLNNFLQRKLRMLQTSVRSPQLDRIAFEKRGEWLREFLKKLDSEIENDYTYMAVQTWIESATEDNNYRRLIKSLVRSPSMSEQGTMDQLRRSEELLHREKERLAWILDKVSNL